MTKAQIIAKIIGLEYKIHFIKDRLNDDHKLAMMTIHKCNELDYENLANIYINIQKQNIIYKKKLELEKEKLENKLLKLVTFK